MTESLWILDTFGWLYQSYHALPKTWTDPDGEPTSVVHGLLNQCLSALRAVDVVAWPSHWIAAWDHHSTERLQLLPMYKATRPAQDDLLFRQVGQVREVLALLGIPVAEDSQAEADDVIATLVELWNVDSMEGSAFEGMPAPVSIFTVDRDLLALLDRHVRVRLRDQWYDADRYETEYGVQPWQHWQLKILQGDASDNVPGIPGVGAATARELIAHYGTVSAVVSAATRGGLKGKRKLTATLIAPETAQHLARNAEVLRLRLIERGQLSVTLPLWTPWAPDWSGLYAYCQRRRLRVIADQVRILAGKFGVTVVTLPELSNEAV